MNKYQIALIRINNKLCVGTDEHFDDIKTLTELVNKTIPKKPKINEVPYNHNIIEFECPSCNKITHTNFIRHYCGECGQALDWCTYQYSKAEELMKFDVGEDEEDE